MSDQRETPAGSQDELSADERETAAEATPAEAEPATPADTQSDISRAPEPPPQRKGPSLVAWLALVASVAVAGGAAWLYPQLQLEKQALGDRLQLLETGAGNRQDNLTGLQANLQQSFRSDLGDLKSALQGETGQLTAELSALELRLEEQNAAMDGQREALDLQQSEIARLNATDRDSWLLAEVEYLLRLANQRLIMAGDTVAAKGLLSGADDVLRKMDAVGLHEVRAAVAADLAAVRAVPTVDVEGIYLRLSALIEQADSLVIFKMPEREAAAPLEPAKHWQDRLRQGYQTALRKLSDYVVIRRRDVPMQALMDPQWEGLVRQNLRMLLEQSQVALLSGNQVLYRESLERAAQWLAQFEDSDAAAAAAMRAEINQLVDARIRVDTPEISRSILALDTAIEQFNERQMSGEG